MDSTSFSREEALANPDAVNAAIAAAMGNAGIPIIPEAPGDLISLPGGLVYAGNVIRTATIKELNGADEEALSRAIKSGNGFHFMDVLLQRGVTSLGGHPATPDILGSLLMGDREELLIQIRVATYGEELSIDAWICPECNGVNDLSFNLITNVERHRLHSTEGEPTIMVPLRKGAIAIVKFPTGADMMAASNQEWTNTERNSELLRRCVKTIEKASGEIIHVQAFPSTVTNMSIPDRRIILQAMHDQSPGPRFSNISFVHQECQKEVTLALSIADMFRELIIGL